MFRLVHGVIRIVLLIAFSIICIPANAGSWQQLINDNFARPDTNTGAAGNQTSVGNNWIDRSGGVWRINGGTLQGIGAAGPGNMLLRPPSEAATEQRVTMARQLNRNTETFGAVLRVQSDGSRYFVFQGGPILRVSRIDAGGSVSTMASTLIDQASAGQFVTLNASITTTSAGPGISATFTNSTSGYSATITATDGGAAAIDSPGQCGIDTASPGIFNFRQVSIYENSQAAATVMPAAVPAGAVNTVLHFTGIGTTWTRATDFTLTASGSHGASLGAVAFLDATHINVMLKNAGSATDSLVLTDSTNQTVTAVSVTAPTVYVTPTQILDSSPENVLTVTGNEQTWRTNPPQFQVSGLSGVSIVRTKVINDITAQVTVRSGASVGSVLLRDVNVKYPAQASFAVVHAIKMSDPNVLLSPYNWDLNGSLYGDTNYAGAYMKVKFTTIAGGAINILYDPTPNAAGGLATSNYPTIGWALNPSRTGGKWNYAQLTPYSNSITILTDAPPGTYELDVYVKSIRGGSDAGRWNPSCRKVRLLGIQVNSSAVTAPLVRRSANAIIFGDSITQGVGTLGISSAGNDDAMQSWGCSVADALDAEYGNIGMAGQQWGGSFTSIPAFYSAANTPHDTFSYHEAGHSRLVGGKLFPAPDYVFINMGTNDGVSGIASNVAATIDGLRRISGPDARIFIILPFGGYERSATTGIPAGVNAYLAANHGDSNVFLLDCGSSIAPPAGLNNSTRASENQYSFDGLHPKNYVSIILGAKIAQLAERAEISVRGAAIK